LVVVIGVALALIDEPLRRYAEREFNRHVDGYTLTIGKLDFHPIGLSVDFQDARLSQNEHPDPPVAEIPKWHASIHWAALLRGYLVSDHFVERPVLHITRPQAKAEARDDKPLENRGWQDAILAVYPLKIDVFRMSDGDITYVDNPRSAPLHVRRLNLVAENIRNVHSRERTYPSTLHLDGRVLDSGSVTLDGSADFLSEPHLGIYADMEVKDIRLDDVVPVTGRYNIQLRKGQLSARGHVEYSPSIKEAKLTDLLMEGVHLDYVHAARTESSEKKVAVETAQAAAKLSNHPEWLVRIDQGKILHSELGFVNKAADPEYRVFLSDANIGLDNFSNQLSEGTAYLKLTGKFMGTGPTQVSATFRPETQSPDFDLKLRLVNTRLRALNDVLRAYGKFDVTEGMFSLFSEFTVKDGAVTGYVKPLFKDVDVYDSVQDRDKGLLQKLYESVVGGASDMLKNRTRDEVATKADVSGPLKNPRMNTWEMIVKLLQNAFVQAILPGLEREAKGR
jgi:hypothetical protein